MYYLTNNHNQEWCRVDNYLEPNKVENLWLSSEEINNILSYHHMSIKPHHYWTKNQASQAIKQNHLENAQIVKGLGLNV